jgi:5-methyltetrahydropteroyltriglutamate--homocysteine methyltransferase
MAILTTTLGAFPKPDYVPVLDWFQSEAGPDAAVPTEAYEDAMRDMGDEAEEIFARAARDVLADQEAAGIDIPTDGEVRRENYIHYHCRHLDGIDFSRLTEKELRGGAYSARLPTITGPIRARAPFLVHDWQIAQSYSDRPVKVTLPGPMTITGTVADDHYGDAKRLGADLGDAINAEILALAAAGVRYIQVDEAVFARKVEAAHDYGFDNLERCFQDVPEAVERGVHMCCGYPDRLDNPDYPKAPKESYFDLAEAIDRSSIQAISIEDAHRANDLALLEAFTRITAILGVVAVAKSRVESADEIAARLDTALDHIDAARLVAAPDCGLGLLDRSRALAKLTALGEAARRVG